MSFNKYLFLIAHVAELVDALDSGSSRDFLGGCSSHLGRKVKLC